MHPVQKAASGVVFSGRLGPDAVVAEGAGHSGMSALIDLLARQAG